MATTSYDGLSKPVPSAILRELKRSDGLTVRELAASIRMSYMGVKKPCLDLARRGFISPMRRPVAIGRPEMVYRLTEKGHDVFSAKENSITMSLLAAARELYGPTAPGKLLFIHFREKGKIYAKRVRGDTPLERAEWFLREREKEGYLCRLEKNAETGAFRILQRHSPISDVTATYPDAARMEADMIERILGATTRRITERRAHRPVDVFQVFPSQVADPISRTVIT